MYIPGYDTELLRQKLQKDLEGLDKRSKARIRAEQFLLNEIHALFREVSGVLAPKVNDPQLARELAIVSSATSAVSCHTQSRSTL